MQASVLPRVLCEARQSHDSSNGDLVGNDNQVRHDAKPQLRRDAERVLR